MKIDKDVAPATKGSPTMMEEPATGTMRNSTTGRSLSKWAARAYRSVTSITPLIVAIGALITALVALYNALPHMVGFALPRGKIDVQYLIGRPAYPYDVDTGKPDAGKRVDAVAECSKGQIVIGGFCNMNLVTVVHYLTTVSDDKRTFSCGYHVLSTDSPSGKPRSATATAVCLKVDE